MAGPRPDWQDPEAWLRAEDRAGRALARAAEAVARLDERLHRAPEATGLARRERLALDQVSGLLWTEGVRLRPEILALADADRLGRTEDEAHVLARTHWARRRLMGQGTEAAWRAARAALDSAHVLTRSAADFHVWRGLGLS